MRNLGQLSFEFFREFLRCEYCLKVVGLRDPMRKDPTADWGAFSAEVQHLLEAPSTSELKEAVDYYLAYSPKKQIARDDGAIDWKGSLPDHEHQVELILNVRPQNTKKISANG